MASILNDIDITLNNGDLEVFRQWVEAKLESKDKQIAHLLHRIQKLETTCDILTTTLQCKVDRPELDYRLDELHQIYKYRYEN